MNFLIFAIVAVLAEKKSSRFRPVQLLEELPQKSVPRLVDFMQVPMFDTPIPKVKPDEDLFE